MAEVESSRVLKKSPIGDFVSQYEANLNLSSGPFGPSSAAKGRISSPC